MTGGSGTRLWPLSNSEKPKPFHAFIPGKKTLLQETVARLQPLIPASQIIVIGSEKHIPLLRKQLQHVPSNQIIGEPVAKNTAATVALAAKIVHEKDPNGLLLVLPADHWISTKEQFNQSIAKALSALKLKQTFVVFGIKPTFPSISYGYIHCGKKIASNVFQLKQFVEKPNQEKALKFIKSKEYLWHAGIFLAPAQLILDSFSKFQPKILAMVNRLSVEKSKIKPAALFKKLPSISIDYAVLEHVCDAAVVSCEFNWCDVGSWKSFEAIWPKDHDQNAFHGNVFSKDSGANIIYSPKKQTVLFGIKDLVIVDTDEVLLVAPKNASESMRDLVESWHKQKMRKKKVH